MRRALVTVLAGLLLMAGACTTSGSPVTGPAPGTTTKTVTATVTTTRAGATATVIAPPSATDSSSAGGELNYARTVAGVRAVLAGQGATGYGLTHVTDVVCPPNMPVLVGQTYDCTARIGAERKTVTITIRSADGQFEVGAPH